jgi:hypothetical protein
MAWHGLFILPLFLLSAWYSGPTSWRDAEQRWIPDGITWMQTFGLWSKWDMFAPMPVHDDYVLRARGEFSDGTYEDLFGNQAGDGQPGWAHGFIYSRWTKIMESLVGNADSVKREWAMWQCRSHNRGNPSRKLLRFTLAKWDQLIPPFDQPFPPSHVYTLWNHHCFDEDKDQKKDNKKISRVNNTRVLRMDPNKSEPPKPEADAPGPDKADSRKAEAVKAEDVKAEPAKEDKADGETEEPDKAEAAKPEPAKREKAKSATARPEVDKTDSNKPEGEKNQE